MGLFDKFKKDTVTSGVTDVGNTQNRVNLEKSTVTLEKVLVNLEKKTGVSFEKHTAKVAVVMDFSGSMRHLYNSGAVQEMLERFMPLALKFDDNGELEVWMFHDHYKRMTQPMTINNYNTYIADVVNKSGIQYGLTEYAPVLKDVLKKYFEEEKATSNVPTFVIFVTDGENSDKRATDEIIKESAKHNIFIQFVGIGNERFSYLQELDTLAGREVDNTGFFKVPNMSKETDDSLYTMLLDQYPDWRKAKNV